jgi:hypothetical protein
MSRHRPLTTQFGNLQSTDRPTTAGAKLTIDRYLGAHVDLRVVTTYPFIAEHKEDLVSSRRGFRDTAYKEWITRSEHRLGEKLRNLPDATTQSAR